MIRFCFSLIFCFVILGTCPALALKHAFQLKEHHIYRVVKVIDGDTIKLNNGQIVRLIGIDAPETKENPKLKRDIVQRHTSKRSELSRGRRAYQFTKRLVEGKKVKLEFDRNIYDNYGRALSYVYLANGTFVNAEIVKSGYAYVYSIKPDLKYSKLFQKLYKKAQREHRGLWGKERPYNSKAVRWFKVLIQ